MPSRGRPLLPGGSHGSRYTPDTRQRLARATRFFARVGSFDLECPHCGKVYVLRGTDARLQRHLSTWDPTTARFTCTAGCHRVYIIGIVAWPVGKGIAEAGTPRDQVPTPRQLAALRKEGGGWWLADEAKQRYAIPDETNLTTEEDRPDPEPEEDLP